MYCLRRAAGRLLSAQVTTPVRQSWTARSNTSRFPIHRRLPQPLLQNRWNSNDAKPEHKAEAEPPVEPVPEAETKATIAAEVETAVETAFDPATESEPMTEAQLKTDREDATGPKQLDYSGLGVDREAIKKAHNAEPEMDQQTLEATLRENAKGEKRDIIMKNSFEPKESIYIGNLFYDITAEDIKEEFSKFGTVEQVNIIHDSRGISKGFGYVQFDSISAARRAISSMHLRIYEGRRLVVYFAQENMVKSEPLSPISRTLYIGNMPFEMTDRDINNLFKDVVNVIDVRVSVDRRTGQLRGFLHAEFVDVESARTAMEVLGQKAPYGRKLRVDYSTSNRTARPKRSPKLIHNSMESIHNAKSEPEPEF